MIVAMAIFLMNPIAHHPSAQVLNSYAAMADACRLVGIVMDLMTAAIIQMRSSVVRALLTSSLSTLVYKWMRAYDILPLVNHGIPSWVE